MPWRLRMRRSLTGVPRVSPTGPVHSMWVHDLLRPGGYLFLGHAESLSRVTDMFTPIRFQGAMVYRKEGKLAAPSLDVVEILSLVRLRLDRDKETPPEFGDRRTAPCGQYPQASRRLE